MLPLLFKPLTLRSQTLSNRIVVAPEGSSARKLVRVQSSTGMKL